MVRQYFCKTGVNLDALQSPRHYNVNYSITNRDTEKDSIILYEDCFLVIVILTKQKSKGKDYYKTFSLLPVFLLNCPYLESYTIVKTYDILSILIQVLNVWDVVILVNIDSRD